MSDIEDAAGPLLKSMLVDHSYYCATNNYFDSDTPKHWDDITDFLEEFGNADIDYNLVFRWDVKAYDLEEGDGKYQDYYAEIFMMHQRKGLFLSHTIDTVTEKEIPMLREYLQKHWEYLKGIWEPISMSENNG